MTCVVCDGTQNCEFCPRIPAPIIDRDPGDETDPPGEQSRSYLASYREVGTLIFNYRRFIGPDSFLDAVMIAEGMREDNEQLINLTSEPPNLILIHP